MARLLSRALIRLSSSSSSSLSVKSPALAPSSRILSHRNRSNQSGKAQLIEVDLESEADVEVLGIRRLEDVINGIIAKRSAPDWLPFIPGSSYWVPPRTRRPYDVVGVVGKSGNPVNEDESLSFSSVRGWPSSAYFLNGSSSVHHVPVEVDTEVEVKVQRNSENSYQSEDEG